MNTTYTSPIFLLITKQENFTKNLKNILNEQLTKLKNSKNSLLFNNFSNFEEIIDSNTVIFGEKIILFDFIELFIVDQKLIVNLIKPADYFMLTIVDFIYQAYNEIKMIVIDWYNYFNQLYVNLNQMPIMSEINVLAKKILSENIEKLEYELNINNPKVNEIFEYFKLTNPDESRYSFYLDITSKLDENNFFVRLKMFDRHLDEFSTTEDKMIAKSNINQFLTNLFYFGVL